MSPASPPTKSARGQRKRSVRIPPSLDPIATDVLRLLALTFHQCGYEPAQLVNAFKSALKKAPAVVDAGLARPEWGLHDPGHVLTLWNSDPDYVDEDGKPRPIPARGPAPSIEALARRVRSNLSLEHVLSILEHSHAVRRQGRLFILLDEFVLHAPRTKTQSMHHLLVLNQLLQNFEFNSQRPIGTPSWPQRVADCPDFPEHELPGFIARFTEVARRFMVARDQDMARVARKAGPAVARVRPEINLFLTVAPAVRTTRKKRRS